MNNIQILDCTLRDGGRIINCEFLNRDIEDISYRLSNSNIDIVELGFLRDKIHYQGNSTFFEDVDQMIPFINKNSSTMYVAFIDYGMFDFDTLKHHDGKSIDGIRVGFTKKNFKEHQEDLLRCLKSVKQKGYRLFIQGVNSLGYNDQEFLEVIQMVNEIEPYSFGIVDTYGSMYMDDLRHYYQFVHQHLKKQIWIDFHSHNNFQLSFAFAQEFIRLAEETNRNVIIDATLNGMGKCAGNLNTELIVDYLNRKKQRNYDFDEILDIIDEHMYRIKEEKNWGYSIPAMMAGIFGCHPNNIIYLTEQFRLATKDIKYIVSMIDKDLRQRYDYDNIKRIYQEYNSKRVDDQKVILSLKEKIGTRPILVLLPGKTLVDYREQIEAYIEKNHPFLISVNFVTTFSRKENRLAFFGSEKRLKEYTHLKDESILLTSNIRNTAYDLVNYNTLIEPSLDIFDNTFIMLMNLLKRLHLTNVCIAGLDGFKKEQENYFSDRMNDKRFKEKYQEINQELETFIQQYLASSPSGTYQLLTPSIYEKLFKERKGIACEN